ncbi:hypothetical protein JOB18_012829 [Solea senegalensis]|uniref:Uncharacterized protein n=1 Tax=Solea senegalensis TaxID=28829 RepID=A0AAV6P8Q7_SOLSE|nr:hypothetical protein JOB18_012829 [Solea senegalensis]
MIYPDGWDSDEVKRMCGEQTDNCWEKRPGTTPSDLKTEEKQSHRSFCRDVTRYSRTQLLSPRPSCGCRADVSIEELNFSRGRRRRRLDKDDLTAVWR